MSETVRELEERLREITQYITDLERQGLGRSEASLNLRYRRSQLEAQLAQARLRPNSPAFPPHAHGMYGMEHAPEWVQLAAINSARPAASWMPSRGTVLGLGAVGAAGALAKGYQNMIMLPQLREALGVVSFGDAQAMEDAFKTAQSLYGWQPRGLVDRAEWQSCYQLHGTIVNGSAKAERFVAPNGSPVELAGKTLGNLRRKRAVGYPPPMVAIERTQGETTTILRGDPARRDFKFTWLPF